MNEIFTQDSINQAIKVIQTPMDDSMANEQARQRAKSHLLMVAGEFGKLITIARENSATTSPATVYIINLTVKLRQIAAQVGLPG